MFASVAPLSDMAVPKALPIPASELEERRRRLYKDPQQRPANNITRRHSPTRRHLAAAHTVPAFIAVAGFSLYALLPGRPPTATCKTGKSPPGNQSSGWQMSTHLPVTWGERLPRSLLSLTMERANRWLSARPCADSEAGNDLRCHYLNSSPIFSFG